MRTPTKNRIIKHNNTTNEWLGNFFVTLDKHTTTHNQIGHLREQLIDSLTCTKYSSGVARRNKEILLVSDLLFKPHNIHTHSQHSARFLRTLCAQLRRPRNFSETRSAQHTHCVTWLAWLAAFMYIESIGALPPQIPVHKTGVVCSTTQRAISNERNYLTFRIVRAGQQFASIAINERTHKYSATYAA